MYRIIVKCIEIYALLDVSKYRSGTESKRENERERCINTWECNGKRERKREREREREGERERERERDV